MYYVLICFKAGNLVNPSSKPKNIISLVKDLQPYFIIKDLTVHRLLSMTIIGSTLTTDLIQNLDFYLLPISALLNVSDFLLAKNMTMLQWQTRYYISHFVCHLRTELHEYFNRRLIHYHAERGVEDSCCPPGLIHTKT